VSVLGVSQVAAEISAKSALPNPLIMMTWSAVSSGKAGWKGATKKTAQTSIDNSLSEA
jgi:hypothetical protein